MVMLDTGYVVLILVLVEDGFRGGTSDLEWLEPLRLNPCSCGRWLQSMQ